jgi:hypothetical protein
MGESPLKHRIFPRFDFDQRLLSENTVTTISKSWDAAANAIVTLISVTVAAWGALVSTADIVDFDSASRYRDSIDHLERIRAVKDFLVDRIGWNGQVARWILQPPGLMNSVSVQLFLDQNSFFQKLEEVKQHFGDATKHSGFQLAQDCQAAGVTDFSGLNDGDVKLRNHLVNGFNRAQELDRWMIELGLNRPASQLTIEQVRLLASIPDTDIHSVSSIVFASVDFKPLWYCGQDLLSAAEDLGKPTPSRLESADGNYKEFDEVVSKSDAFGDTLKNVTVAAFPQYEKDAYSSFAELVTGIKGDKPLHISDWVPALKVSKVLRLFPAFVVVIYVIIWLLLNDLRAKLHRADTDLGENDGGIANALILPRPVGGKISAASYVFSVVAFSSLASLTILGAALQHHLSVALNVMLPGVTIAGIHLVDGDFANSGAENVTKLVEPGIVQILLCGLLIPALIAVLLLHRKVLTKAKEKATPPNSGGGEGDAAV